MKHTYLFIELFIVLVVQSCSLNKMVVSFTEPMLNNGVQALYSETDIAFAKTALPGNIKLLEGFYRSDPENRKLLLMLCQGYSAYALGYLEDEEPERARQFYYRSWQYAQNLFPDQPVLQNGHEHRNAEIESVLKKMDKEDVERLFWLGLSWGSYVNFSISDPEVIADLVKVQAIMNRILELDENYYFGGAHMFWGTYYASVPQMLGGQPEKAKMHFQKAMEISGGKFLFVLYFYAKTYAYQIQDRDLFEQTLQKIIAADPHLLPGMELPNALAKARAQRLLQEADILF